MNDPDLKQAAVEFLRMSASGKIRDAYARFVAPGFRHHNPFFRGDADSLMRGMEENAVDHPSKVLEVQRAVQEGDLVAVHSRVKLKPGDLGAALAHIFRFQDGKVVELWDIGQPVPQDSPNQYGMF
jgi:predicted SnoaL-like aldol condensation-catalyzing enzyme